MVDVSRRTISLFGRLCAALIVACAASPTVASASEYAWNVDNNGLWNVAGNWTVVSGPAGLGYPNLAGDIAVFPVAATSLPRTITIPNGVTILLGRLQFDDDNDITITAAGTGRLVLADPGPEVNILKTASATATIAAPVELQDLCLVGVTGGPLVFGAGISESGGSFGLRKDGAGRLRFQSPVPNTYTGVTTVTVGRLELQHTSITEAIKGALVIGDGVGVIGSAEVRWTGGPNQIANTSAVTVQSDGLLNMNNVGENVGAVTVTDGLVQLGNGATGLLNMTSLNMTGGTLATGAAGSQFVLNGNLTATSSASSLASIEGSGSLNLNGATRLFTVNNGPSAIDLRIESVIVNGPSAAGLTKQGDGVLSLTDDNTFTGDINIGNGIVFVNGSQPQTTVFVSAASATLGGTGTVGPINVGAGAVAPGNSPGILNSGPIVIGASFPLKIELNGPTVGTDYDQLNVTGQVFIGSAALDLTLGFTPSAGSQFTIVRNDGTDTIDSGFAGLSEGTVFTVGSTQFQITYQGGDGNDIVLSTTGALSYYLAEGATGGFFDEDVLIANANTAAAPVTLTFLMEGGATVVDNRTVPAQSRITVHVDSIAGLEQTSASVQVTSNSGLPLIVERSMFWDATYYGGHTANAVSLPRTSWVFAEGSQGFFDTYVLVANANAVATNVTMTFLREADVPVVRMYPMTEFSRLTVYAGDVAELVGRSFGVVVESTLPVTAERSMYFASVPGKFWAGGHNNMGIPSASTQWFHAEGATGGFFNTFILLSNPQTGPANVTLRFLLDTGQEITENKTLGAKERLTINPAAEGIPQLTDAAFSTVVQSDVPIVSERSMYWPGDASPFGEGHNSAGVVTTGTKWGLAEGRVGGPLNYFTYILLANPGSTAADVTITYLREGAGPVVKTYTVLPTSRFNVDVRAVVPEIADNSMFGAKIEVMNGVPIAVERSLYWNANGVFWAGGTNALATLIP